MGYIGQAEDEWEAKQRKLKAKAERASKEACPVCGKRCTNVHQHAKDVHNAKLVEVRQPKYIAIGR